MFNSEDPNFKNVAEELIGHNCDVLYEPLQDKFWVWENPGFKGPYKTCADILNSESFASVFGIIDSHEITTLGDLYSDLEKHVGSKHFVKYDFSDSSSEYDFTPDGYYHSWRGDYACPAFGINRYPVGSNKSLPLVELVDMIKYGCVHGVLYGYKGGEFPVKRYTNVYASEGFR